MEDLKMDNQTKKEIEEFYAELATNYTLIDYCEIYKGRCPECPYWDDKYGCEY
jgi:hypothetical protein